MRPLTRREFGLASAAGLALYLPLRSRHPSPTTMNASQMITIRRSHERGHANHGWLDARHTFSFANYYDPAHVHFGPLRVLNQDRIRAARGFPTHGHDNMEIVTYVLSGELEHRDSMGHGSKIRPGDVQLMSAGSGLTHSEFNGSEEQELHLLQMWVFPRERDTKPRYEQKHFDEESRRGRLRLVASPDGSDQSLTIGQDARLFAGILDSGDESAQLLPPGRMAWLHVATGSIELNGQYLEAGDGAAIAGEGGLQLLGLERADLVLWELPEEKSA